MVSRQTGQGQQAGGPAAILDHPALEVRIGSQLFEPGAVGLAARHVCIGHPAGHIGLAAPLEQALFVLGKEIAKVDHGNAPRPVER